MLDFENVFDMVLDLMNEVNHTIWIGKMNHIKKNIVIDSPEIEKEVRRIEEGQTEERLRMMYYTFGDFFPIRYKSCILRALGMKPQNGPEGDI